MMRTAFTPSRTVVCAVALATVAIVSLRASADSGPFVDPCPWDLTGDGEVDGADLSELLALWGLGGTTADLDGSGTVNGADLAHLLRSWGPCALVHDCNQNLVEDSVEIANGTATDCDGDGMPDDCQDCNGNGLSDDCDIASRLESDCNGDGVPDSCEDDCNGNGIPDTCELASDPTLDCDGDGGLDECQRLYVPGEDCDGDGVLDACAIAEGLVSDCNGNGTPDSCEPDCDGNGVPDDCDLANGAADCNANGLLDLCEADCDGNGIPDECDVALDPLADCDGDGILDSAAIAAGIAPDTNLNGTPDWCELTLTSHYDVLTFCEPADGTPGLTSIDFSADPLPLDFFGPGSEPFVGTIYFASRPIDVLAAGGGSMVLRRSADPFLPRDPVGGVQTVPIELVALSLVSSAPIPVTIGGELEDWRCTAHVVQPSQGSLTATKTHADGGVADVSLLVSMQLTFTNAGRCASATTVRAFPLGTTEMPWVHVPDPDLDLADDPASFFTIGVDGPPGGQSGVLATWISGIGDAAMCVVNAVKYTVDLEIHNGLQGQTGGQKVDDAKEASVGAVTVANLNDTDGDGTQDVNDDEVKAPNVNPKGIDEVDLMKLVVNKPLVNDGGMVKLEKVGTGNFKVWTASTKGTELALPAMIAVGDLPKTYWVEARAASGGLADIGLMSTYKKATDEVRATGVWSTKDSVKVTRAAGGADNALPGDMGAALQGFIDSFKAQDGSRYGYGPFATNGTVDRRTGGRIAIEFATAPAGAEGLGIVWDQTRRLEHRDWRIADGAQTLTDIGRRNFPAQQEEPNDDSHASDEDNTPQSQHIYVFDGPSDSITASEAFYVTRNNFVEYTRVQLNKTAFANRNGLREGSRASPFVPWHYVDYLVRDASNRRVTDNSGKNPAASPPVRNGGGNGVATTKILAGAVTEGFTATYNLANLRWTLTGTSGDPAVNVAVGAAPAGTQWKLKFGNKVEVTITQGATAFANGATFRFSIYTAMSGAGKIGEVAEGSATIADEGN